MTPRIKVIGIGGAGGNAVARMFKDGISAVDLIAVNTDAQALREINVPQKILIGQKTTGGLGAGMDVRLGERAFRESYQDLKSALLGAEMVFLTCGLGGGTGTSGIPILGEIAKGLGALTVAVVTLPFSFEGAQRRNIANRGLKNLAREVDAFLVIPNDKLLSFVSPDVTLENAFWLGDGILREAVKGIADLVSLSGIINVDFADLRSILENSGRAFLGIGCAKGERRALLAVNLALRSPLLDFSIQEPQGILLNIAGREDLTLTEVAAAATFIKRNSQPGTKIIFGVSEDSTLKEEEIKVTVIATSKA